MSPAAERLLAALADGYRVEVEYVGGWDADEWHLRKSIKFDGHLRDAARELYGLGLVDSSANGSGCCWINDAGRAAVDVPPKMDIREVRDDVLEFAAQLCEVQARELEAGGQPECHIRVTGALMCANKIRARKAPAPDVEPKVGMQEADRAASVIRGRLP